MKFTLFILLLLINPFLNKANSQTPGKANGRVYSYGEPNIYCLFDIDVPREIPLPDSLKDPKTLVTFYYKANIDSMGKFSNIAPTQLILTNKSNYSEQIYLFNEKIRHRSTLTDTVIVRKFEDVLMARLPLLLKAKRGYAYNCAEPVKKDNYFDCEVDLK